MNYIVVRLEGDNVSPYWAKKWPLLPCTAEVAFINVHCPECNREWNRVWLGEHRPQLPQDLGEVPTVVVMDGWESPRGSFGVRYRHRSSFSCRHYYDGSSLDFICLAPEARWEKIKTRRYYRSDLWPVYTKSFTGGVAWSHEADHSSHLLVWGELSSIPTQMIKKVCFRCREAENIVNFSVGCTNVQFNRKNGGFQTSNGLKVNFQEHFSAVLKADMIDYIHSKLSFYGYNLIGCGQNMWFIDHLSEEVVDE